MGSVTSIDDKKKKSKISSTTNTGKKAAGAGLISRPEAVRFEQRGEILPSAQEQLPQVSTELAGYLDAMDMSKLTDVQRGEGEILKKVLTALQENKDERGIFKAVTILFSESDLKWTGQLEKFGLRIIRLYQLQRQGTTDVIEFPVTKEILKEKGLEDKLLLNSDPNDKEAIWALKNVENARAGTTELEFTSLERARNMVLAALSRELKLDYQAVLPPHQMEGPQGDMQRIKTDVSPDVILFLRLFESLTIAIIKQREITQEQEGSLKFKREEVSESLNKMGKIQGVVLSADARDKFRNKMSIMNLDQLKYFDFKILELSNQVKGGKITKGEANDEIESWLNENRKFSKAELHAELEERKAKNKSKDEQDLEELRAAA